MAPRKLAPFLLDLDKPTPSRPTSPYVDEPALEELRPRVARTTDSSGDGTLMTEVKTETTDDN